MSPERMGAPNDRENGARVDPPPPGQYEPEQMDLEIKNRVEREVIRLSRLLEVEPPRTVEDLERQMNIWLPPRKVRDNRRNTNNNNNNNVEVAEGDNRHNDNREYEERRQRAPGRPMVEGNNRERRRLFRGCQELWRKDRSGLASKLINGVDPLAISRASPEIERAWFDEMEQPSVEEERHPRQITNTTEHELMGEVKAQEIEKALKFSNHGTAPGWDGITITDLCKPNMKGKIGWLLNGALMLRDTPRCWKRGRT